MWSTFKATDPGLRRPRAGRVTLVESGKPVVPCPGEVAEISLEPRYGEPTPPPILRSGRPCDLVKGLVLDQSMGV
jgi:hypothetical protein